MKEIIVNTQLPVIKTNFEEVKESLKRNLEKYENTIVTEDNLKDCKAMQKELAGLRNQVDNKRKEVKRVLEAPIKEHDKETKELIAIIEEVEKPIKEGIKVFDNKRREEKRKFADIKIFEICQKLNLEKKYADQLTVLDKYLNLSASAKSVVEDIEQRAEVLKQQQNMDKVRAEMVKANIESALETVNLTLKTPLEYKDFEKYLALGWDGPRIVREINERAAQIRQAEKAAEEMATKRIEEEKQKEEVQIPMDLKPKAPEVPKEVKEDEPRLYVELYVEHNLEEMKILSKYLKDKGYKYIVHEQGKVNPK
ncbi:DUF1351 domain-containing protein [Clostridium paraputrificum]|uniref:DUF1351 domain-containing protein n=1 Tax=Clostridium paraputrificum TaxID=29363 RepID=UPI00189D94AA|nr:DUF1351 domain-containing protein [Clostridium paraputrificum]MDB2116932.1 DUF1351 domain-containing protein [Clostridium paraputrificum]DAJ63176.1 MAG TPA: Protein of unknown function (DUF1351) [Caudoviricetes sp.]